MFGKTTVSSREMRRYFVTSRFTLLSSFELNSSFRV
jgi:hypothetical protein